MNYKINYLKNVNIDIPYDLILFRLGYKKKKTKLTDLKYKQILNLIDNSFNLCDRKIIYKFCKKENINFNRLIIDSKFIIKSKNLFNLLANCSDIILMASTVGNKIISKRDYEIKYGNPVFSLILDATASEIADGLLDWLEKYLQVKLMRESKFLTRRFSPGYGDLDLSIQRKIYNYLKLKKFGIKINAKNILIPEKSVIAIAGVKNK